MAATPTTPQKLLAEVIGTACLVYVGAGSAAATGVIAAGTKVPFSIAQLGMISFAFMFVIVGIVYAIGHISGGHINPAVTVFARRVRQVPVAGGAWLRDRPAGRRHDRRPRLLRDAGEVGHRGGRRRRHRLQRLLDGVRPGR